MNIMFQTVRHFMGFFFLVRLLEEAECRNRMLFVQGHLLCDRVKFRFPGSCFLTQFPFPESLLCVKYRVNCSFGGIDKGTETRATRGGR